MIKQIAAAVCYGVGLLQFSLCFSAEDQSGHLIAGWVAWVIGTVFVIWDLLEED